MSGTGLLGPSTQKMAEDTLRREHARAQQELDDWRNRANAARVCLGAESPVTAACDQMVTFWTQLRSVSAAALAKATRPIATLRLRHEETT